MTRYLALIALAVLIAPQLCAEQILPAGAKNAIYGTVLDAFGKPLEGALVTDGRQTVFTSEDGSFTMLNTGAWLSVSRVNFLAQRIRREDVSVWTPVIMLQDSPITMPTVRVTETAADLFSDPPDRVSLPLDPDRHYYSAGEMLSGSASAHSNDVRLKGEAQSVSLLGNLSRHSLIVLDGVPLNPDGGSFDLSLLDPDNIESIELIKNNASVYGGGSAIGGVVKITSRKRFREGGENVSLSTELGSFGYARNTLVLGFTRPRWDLRFSLSNLDTDNDFRFDYPDWWAADSSAARDNNAKRQHSASASASWRTGKASLSLQSDYSSFHRQLPGTINFLDVYRLAYLEGWANRNRLALDLPLGAWQSSFLSWLNFDSTLYDNTRAPLPVFVSSNRQRMANYGLRGNLGRKLDLAPGLSAHAGIYAEAGANRYRNLNLLVAGQDIDHRSPFANTGMRSGLELDSGLWTANASASLRFDRNGGDDNLTWRVEGSLNHYGFVETMLGATLGTSFALPSPYDLWWRGDSQTIGNPDLKSELSQGWQVWLANELGPVRIKAAYHRNEIQNLIQWRQVQMFGNVWKPLNIGKARIQNLELEGSLTPFAWLTLSANALLTDAKDLSGGDAGSAPDLMYTPGLTCSAELKTAWKGLDFWTRYSFTGEQWTTPDNLADPLPAYDLLDAGISWGLHVQNWVLIPQFSVRNILDRRYEVYAYVPQPGISLYGGVTLRLGE